MNTDQILDADFTREEEQKEVEIVDSSKFLLLYVISFGLYSLWWMFYVWRFFRDKEKSDVMPVWRSIFSIIFIYSLYDKIASFAKQVKPGIATYSSGLMAAVYVILSLLGNLPEPYWLISFGAGLCFLQPINVFNAAIEDSGTYKPKKESGLTGGQIAIVIIGVLFWVLVIIGMQLP